MGSMLLEIIFVAAGTAVGTVGGWLLRGGPPQRTTQRTPAAEPEPEPAVEVAQVETLIAKLHQLTSSVAADIGEHNNRVQEINHELVNGADVVSIVERLIAANGQMQAQLQAAEKRLQTQANEIDSHIKEARTDPLTRLANRRAFDDEIRRCADEYRRAGTCFSVMMLDVDHFKKFNDTYGHQVGDEVLKGVGRVLRREFANNELVCRYGGEEFAVVFPGMSLAEAIERAERGRAAIGSEVVQCDGMDLRVAASGGIAEIRPDEKPEQLVKRADDSLYVAKTNGRNIAYWHDGKDSRPVHEYQPPLCSMDDEAENCLLAAEPKEVFRLGRGLEERRLEHLEQIPGLSNREALVEDLERHLSEQLRRGTPLSLMLLQIDGLAELTDRYGGKAAELAVRAAAQIIRVTKRDMDHAAYLGGNLFGILLPGAELYEASSAAERIRVAMEKCSVPVNDARIEVRVSIGLTDTQAGDECADVLTRASHALEEAARQGGNRVRTAPNLGDPWPLFAGGDDSAMLAAGSLPTFGA